MSYSGYDFSQPDWGAADPFSVPDPNFGAADAYNVPWSETATPSDTGGGFWDNFLKAVPVIGSTFASTYNAVNHPDYPSAYPAPQPQSEPGNAPSSAAPSPLSALLDFHSPYPYLIGGAVLLLVMMNKRSD